MYAHTATHVCTHMHSSTYFKFLMVKSYIPNILTLFPQYVNLQLS